jgi:hypothetical protein
MQRKESAGKNRQDDEGIILQAEDERDEEAEEDQYGIANIDLSRVHQELPRLSHEIPVFDERASEVLDELGLDRYLQSRIGGNRTRLVSRQTLKSRVLSLAQYAFAKVPSFL